MPRPVPIPRVRRAVLRPIRIDLTALDGLVHPQAELLARFVRLIQVQRGDFNGQVLTVRRSDHGALGCILDVVPEAASDRLAALGVLFDPVCR